MAAGSRGVPRFLPTLTEVVHVPPPSGQQDLRPDPVAEREALAERIRAQVQDRLEAQLPAAVADALQAQVDAVVARLRDAMEPLVREAVEQALLQETDPQPPG